MSEVEFLRGFVTERLIAASQEILAAVNRVVAGYEAEASGFRQEIERQRNLLDVLLQPRLVHNKTGDQHLLKTEAEDPPELTYSLDQENPESLHVKEEKEELSTNPEFTLIAVHVKSEDEEERPQSLQHQTAEPPCSSSAEQRADGDYCGGYEPARTSGQHEDLQPDIDYEVLESSSETGDSDDFWSETRAPKSGLNSEVVHVSDADTGNKSDCKKSHRCSECEKTFSKTTALKIHMRIHTGEKPYACATCGKQFSQRGNLKEHMKVHTGEKPFDCATCGKTFRQRSSLTEHMRVHTGEKPFECPICGKTFSHRCSLTEHMRVHTGEKPFECPTCGKTFRQRCILIEHMKVHTGEKPFECATCGKTFRQRCGLTEHMRVHTGEKPFECLTCGKHFRHRGSFNMHLRLHTQEETI